MSTASGYGIPFRALGRADERTKALPTAARAASAVAVDPAVPPGPQPEPTEQHPKQSACRQTAAIAEDRPCTPTSPIPGTFHGRKELSTSISNAPHAAPN